MGILSYTSYDDLYEAMQSEIERRNHERRRGAVRSAEVKLAVAWYYRKLVPLENVTVVPVTYWRWHWPRFEGEVKYRELRYTLALSPPQGTSAEIHEILLEERSRRVFHIGTNLQFFRYLRKGRIDRDREFFCSDQETSLKLAEWIANLWAFERYELFIEERYPRLRLGSTTIETMVGKSGRADHSSGVE